MTGWWLAVTNGLYFLSPYSGVSPPTTHHYPPPPISESACSNVQTFLQSPQSTVTSHPHSHRLPNIVIYQEWKKKYRLKIKLNYFFYLFTRAFSCYFIALLAGVFRTGKAKQGLGCTISVQSESYHCIAW